MTVVAQSVISLVAVVTEGEREPRILAAMQDALLPELISGELPGEGR